jgi:hypothetical protein
MGLLARRGLLCLCGCLLLACARGLPPPRFFSEQHERSVLKPVRFEWLSSERETSVLPSAIALGAKPLGRVLVYLEFAELQAAGRVLRAELLLSPTADAFGSVPVDLSRVEAVSGELRGWGDRPKPLSPRSAALVTARAGPQRLDVTEIVRAQARKQGPLRLLLRADPTDDGEGVLIVTGASGGGAPRLEIYWQ